MPNIPDIQDNLQDELQDLITWMYRDAVFWLHQSTDQCNQKTTSLYTYQPTDAIRKRHIMAVLHISKPWKW